jgi:hypothetical protein
MIRKSRINPEKSNTRNKKGPVTFYFYFYVFYMYQTSNNQYKWKYVQTMANSSTPAGYAFSPLRHVNRALCGANISDGGPGAGAVGWCMPMLGGATMAGSGIM